MSEDISKIVRSNLIVIRVCTKLDTYLCWVCSIKVSYLKFFISIGTQSDKTKQSSLICVSYIIFKIPGQHFFATKKKLIQETSTKGNGSSTYKIQLQLRNVLINTHWQYLLNFMGNFNDNWFFCLKTWLDYIYVNLLFNDHQYSYPALGNTFWHFIDHPLCPT